MSSGSTWQKTLYAAAQQAAINGARRKAPFIYRWEHVQAVVRLALRLAELTGADQEIVEAAAWLHDIAKPGSTEHGRDGAIMARQILTQTDFPPAKINAVTEAIAKHVGLAAVEPVTPLEAAVLWDADKLTKLGATAVLLYTGNWFTEGIGTMATLIPRFPHPMYSEIVRSFHTAPARAAGKKRLQLYNDFYQQAQQEFDGSDLGE